MSDQLKQDDEFLKWLRRMMEALRLDAEVARTAGDREQSRLLHGHADDLQRCLEVTERLRAENDDLRARLAEGVIAFA